MRISSTTPTDPLMGDHPGMPAGPATGVDGARVISPGLVEAWMAAPENRGGGAALREAIEAGDPARLMAIDRELVPLYCPSCQATYCAQHWQRWPVFADDFPGWFEEERGTCPNGHERMILD